MNHDNSKNYLMTEGLHPEEILVHAAEKFNKQLVFASSLGAEDQVIIDMIYRNGLDIPVFTLDTGRLFESSYRLLAATEAKYGIRIELFFPERQSVEKMVSQHGINLFRESVEKRRECCRVRKLEPLARALSPHKAWICGLRQAQSTTRSELQAIEIDAKGMLKINPLFNWSEQQVWDYIHTNKVPYNELHDQGFPSIGCACCTRAVNTGEDIRSGRWWWETPEQKECGLHIVNGKLQRIKNT
ncbi:phosphoadenylyl-sulfate reductase [Lentisphaerota bacterium ZTH]|nr:phosphoadenylyl-sulfate reductase [Lentisphaerota bacterium]WET07313.1 phosphoadenylyl-sulfate reductase [Lentisphaerota bacterium ZTH]